MVGAFHLQTVASPSDHVVLRNSKVSQSSTCGFPAQNLEYSTKFMYCSFDGGEEQCQTAWSTAFASISSVLSNSAAILRPAPDRDGNIIRLIECLSNRFFPSSNNSNESCTFSAKGAFSLSTDSAITNSPKSISPFWFSSKRVNSCFDMLAAA